MSPNTAGEPKNARDKSVDLHRASACCFLLSPGRRCLGEINERLIREPQPCPWKSIVPPTHIRNNADVSPERVHREEKPEADLKPGFHHVGRKDHLKCLTREMKTSIHKYTCEERVYVIGAFWGKSPNDVNSLFTSVFVFRCLHFYGLAL